MRLRLTILTVLVLGFAAIIYLYTSGTLGGGGPAAGTGIEPLDNDKFVTAYVKLAKLAESMPIGTPQYDAERERILAADGITAEQVEQTLAYYNERPDLWQPLWEEIQERLTAELEGLERPPDSAAIPATP